MAYKIVVRARIEALDPALLASTRREQKNRKRACLLMRPQLAQQPIAVETRHHDIREYQIRRIARCRR